MATMPFEELTLSRDDFDNPRHLVSSGLDQEAIRELAIDIGRRGLLYPLLVTDDGLILGGQRRYLAIELIMDEENWDYVWEQLDPDDDAMQAIIDRRRAFYESGVPVRFVDDAADIEGTALADNLHRAGLSSYEIAERLSELAQSRSLGQLAQTIGKSKSYVSRILKAWRGASVALKGAWADGTIPYETVKDLAELDEDDQRRAVARAEAAKARGERAKPGPKGDHGRPGLAATKAAHASVCAYIDQLFKMPSGVVRDLELRYAAGARDALAFVLGSSVPERLAKIAAGDA